MALLRFLFFSVWISLYSCIPKNIPEKVEVIGVTDPEVSLNGTWKFTMDPPEQFWTNEIDISAWSEIQVPGECQMQGFAIKHDLPYVYKHNVHIPLDFKDKNISLDFHGVYSYSRVWINGHFIREHYGGFTKWSCDISEYVTAGESAILTLEIIDRVDDISYGSGYAKHQIGGILRDVVLSAKPTLHFKELYFETDLDEDYRDAELIVNYRLSQNSPATLKVHIYDADNASVAEAEISSPAVKGAFSIPVSNPLKWDAEHPTLYTVTTTISEGDTEVMKIPKKIGFREIQIEGNKLLVNGMPVKLRGACRHDIHPLLGRMTTREFDRQDVLLAKEANMNFIRTSHYPPSEAFLDFCDEYGIYVEDETAVCFVGSHRTFDYQATGASQNLASFTPRYLSQLGEMVNNHRNHPSVIIWSIGNENVFGSNFIASYRWIKENDLTRPVIYSYPGHVPDSVRNYEILSMHYPDFNGNLNQYRISTKGFAYADMPVLFDEWAHVACYNNPTLRYDPNVRHFWGQSLDLMWAKLFEADGGLGGAIWCMIDETFMLPEDLDGFNDWWGKLDANVIPATYMGPTVGYGEWGIVDTWRRKKPEFWATKKAYSPTRLLTKKVNDFTPGSELKIPVHNRFDHTDFSELTIAYAYGDNSGTLKNLELTPHAKGELTIPAQDWKAGTTLSIDFYYSKGQLIDRYEVAIGSRDITLPKIAPGNLQPTEDQNTIHISTPTYSLWIDKKTGLLNDVIVDRDTLIKSGPYINLMVPDKRIQYSTIVMKDYAQNWRCTNFSYTVDEGIVNVHTEGSYDSVAATFDIAIDEKGTMILDYNIMNIPENKMIQEAGIKFIAGNQFTKLSWQREAYFTSYPKTDIGRPNGEIDLVEKPLMNYRMKPGHNWELDRQNFYYHGLDVELPYSNVARAMKENIIYYMLATPANHKMTVHDTGTRACRFDKISGHNILYINNQWDYQSLLWGNYMKMIKTKKEMGGKAVLSIDQAIL